MYRKVKDLSTIYEFEDGAILKVASFENGQARSLDYRGNEGNLYTTVGVTHGGLETESDFERLVDYLDTFGVSGVVDRVSSYENENGC